MRKKALAAMIKNCGGRIRGVNHKLIRRTHICLRGTSASAGIGIGKAVIVEEAELVITRNEVADAEAEIQRFKGALEKTIAATQKMADDLASRVGEKEAEIMQGHMMLLSDPHAYRGD